MKRPATPRGSFAKYIGIVVARLIVAGDVSGARAVARGSSLGLARRVAEARAIHGACRYAKAHFGANLDPWSFR